LEPVFCSSSYLLFLFAARARSNGSPQDHHFTAESTAGRYVVVCNGYLSPGPNAPLLPAQLLGNVTADDGGTFTGSSTVMIGGGHRTRRRSRERNNSTPTAPEQSPTTKKVITSRAHRSISPSSSRRRATASTASQRILARCFRASCGGHRRATETWTEDCGGKHCLGPGSRHRNATVEDSLGLCHVWVILLTAEFVPQLPDGSFHRSDSEGCTTVTIERHSSGRFSAGPLYTCIYVRMYVRFTRTRASPSPESSCCTESIIVFTPTLPKTARFGPWLKFWRTTGLIRA